MAELRGFTGSRIAGFSCYAGKKQTFFWDASTPGLGIRVTEKGAKSYIFEGWLVGRSFRVTIGDVRAWGLADAQAEARRLRVMTDQGIDPRQARASADNVVRAEVQEAARRSATVAHAWKEYVAWLKGSRRQGKYRSNRYLADHERMAAPGGVPKRRGRGNTVAGPLASLMSAPLVSLTEQRLEQWLQDESRTRPSSTAHAFRLLRAFLRWTNSTTAYGGIVAEDVCRSRSVREAVPVNRTPLGDCLEKGQLSNWFSAVQSLDNAVVRTYLQGLLLTGARREELASLRWDDVNFEWRSLTIRDKVDGIRVIPLPPYFGYLLALLKEQSFRPVRITDARDGRHIDPIPVCAWVFPSHRSRDGRIKEPRTAHNRALQAAGLPHVSLHGLRRSFGTLAEWVEAPSGVVAQIMGHKPSALQEKHYKRRPLDLLRLWHERIESWMLQVAGIQDSAPIKRSAGLAA